MEIRVLGPVEAWHGGQSLHLPRRQQRLILGILALDAGKVVTCDRLIDLLWNIRPPRQARAVVQSRLSELRSVVHASQQGAADAQVVSRGDGYILSIPARQVDAHQFRALLEKRRRGQSDEEVRVSLRHALALWRGPVLGGYLAPESSSAFLDLEAARLTAAEQLFDVELRLGDNSQIAEEIGGLLAANPTRERLTEQLMVALHRSGRTAEALQHYEKWRRWLRDELGIDPAAAVQQVHLAILQGNPAIVGGGARTSQEETSGGPSAVQRPENLPMPATNGFVAAVPRILPPDVADFTGRAQEASAISTLLTGRDGGGSGVVAVTGRGGVGKTALSIHVAHRLRDMFPDGQLYANLRGAGDDLPADPFAVVGRFLRYLGVDGGAVPETLEERTDLYRDLLASRRVLVILDNAASDAQVIPLIPGGPNCGVIISSRRRIGTAVGAYVLSLEVLDSENATKLLAQIAGIRRVAIEPAEVRELCAHCGFLPLAVRIAAAKLASKPHWSVSRLLEMLRVERDRLNLLVHGHLDVRANIALSYDVLPTTSQEMLRRLGDIDLPEISVWMSAAAVDMPLGAAEEVLEHLFDAQLLDIAGHDVTGHARYRMHDLVRLFAKERALAEEANSDLIAARGRAFGAWLFLADTAHRVFYGRDFQYIRGGAPRWPFDEGIARELTAEPLRWLETEREGIIAVVDRAASDRSSVCWELATATSPLFELCRLFDDWLDILRKTLAATATMGDVRGSAAIEFWMGCAFGDRTEYRSAHDHFEEAAKLFNMIGDRRGGALTTAYLGMMERLQGNRESALSLCEEALPILHDMDDLGSEAFVLRNLGQLYMEQDSALASAYLRRALAICRATGAQRAEAQVLFWNSMLNGQERRFEDAESDLQNALDICRAIGDRGGEAQCLRGLGITAQRCGDHTKAMSYLNDALALVRQPKPTFMEDQIRRSIADLQSIE